MSHRFIGTWRLTSFELRGDDGQARQLFGANPEGYIMYGADGYMSVAFMMADRIPFAADDPQGGTPAEKQAAMDSFFCYCGRYTVRDATVVHHIEVSLFPNWKGVDQVRRYAFDGDRLTLSTAPMVVAGVEQAAHLVWQRV